MPDSEVARIVAVVPSCSGASASPTSMVTIALAEPSSSMSEIEPIGCPPTRTSLPGTSWPAFWKTALTLYGSASPNIASAANATAAISAASARIRATVEPRSLWSGSRVLPSLLLESKRGQSTDASRSAIFGAPACLLHAEGPLRLPGQELPDELVVGVEELARRARLDDPALPQDRDVVGHPPRRHDVVRDHAVRAAVLLVDLHDELAQERGANRVEPGVRLVEEHDVGVEHQRAREARPRAHTARELVRHLVGGGSKPHLAEAPVHDLADLVLALVGVLAERERGVVEHVHRAEERAVLEQDAELLAHLEQVLVGHVGHGLPVHDHVALVGIEEADHVLDADRLPRAGRAEDHRDLVVRQAEVEPVQHAVAPEGLDDVDELDRVVGAVLALRAGVPLVLVGL